MSRTEWVAAILIIAGGFVLGGVLGYLFVLRPVTETPTPTPTASPEGITTPTTLVDDAEFLDCSKAVVDGISEVDDLVVEVVDTGDPATARLLASKALEVLTILDNCREPTDPTLVEAKELLGVGLDHIVTAGDMLADSNPSGYEFLAEASATINRGLPLLTDLPLKK